MLYRQELVKNGSFYDIVKAAVPNGDNIKLFWDNFILSTVTIESDTTEEKDGHLNEDISDRHYQSLNKEQRKLRPNKDVINKYLDLKFASRKKVLQETPKEERPSKILEAYPCFTDASEVTKL